MLFVEERMLSIFRDDAIQFSDQLIIKSVKEAPTEALQLKAHYCLVRPDGYVALHQPYVAKNQLHDYLSKFLITKESKLEVAAL